MKFLKKLINSEYRELCRFEEIAKKIVALDEEYSNLSDEELKNKTVEFKKELEDGADLDSLIVPAFATVREAAYRVIGEKAYFVQILGGLAIHFGNIAEMKTGEGKTLTETMPTYLNALTGKGVHIVTVNEFLAKRDSEWMGNIYRFLGLTVGLNLRTLSPKEKKEAYLCDVLYSTNNEIGFDYLRDNMVVRIEDKVQRPLNFFYSLTVIPALYISLVNIAYSYPSLIPPSFHTSVSLFLLIIALILLSIHPSS